MVDRAPDLIEVALEIRTDIVSLPYKVKSHFLKGNRMQWLKKTWHICSVKGVEIHLHISMLLIVPLAVAFSPPGNEHGLLFNLSVMVGVFISVVLHEFGHTATARFFRVDVKRIILWPLGGVALLSRKPEKPLHKLMINIAGPLVNILLAIGCIVLFVAALILVHALAPLYVFQTVYESDLLKDMVVQLAALNIVLAILNLLPIYPLDGGAILNALMELIFNRSIANTITIVVGAPLLLGLVILAVMGRDFISLLFCVFFALGLSTLNPKTLRWVNLGINYLFRRSAYYIMRDDYKRAIRILSKALEKNPKDVSHLIGRSIAYLYSMNYDLAQMDIETILQLDPKHFIALGARGDIHALRKEYDSALDDFARAKALNPDYALAYFGCGNVYLDQRHYELALSEYDRAIELKAHFPIVFLLRSMAHYRLQNTEAVHRDQAEALHISPRDGLVMQDVNQGIYMDYLDWAQDYYGWVLEKHPRQWRAYQGRGDAHLVNDQPEAAIADYTRALEMAPKEAILYLRRGLAHQKMDRDSQGENDFRQVLALARNSSLRSRAERLLEQVGSAN